MFDYFNAYSLSDVLKQYPAGSIVGVALNVDNEICTWRESPTYILPVTKIRQTDKCVYLEYCSAGLDRHPKTVHDVLSAIEVTGSITDITRFGREFKQGILSLIGKNIPPKEYRQVQVMSCFTDLKDYERIYDISDVKVFQNTVCLFG